MKQYLSELAKLFMSICSFLNFLLFSLVFASCKKKSDTVDQPENNKAYTSIPYWEHDTLFMRHRKFSHVMDSVITYTDAGRSYFRHRNIQYELRLYEINNGSSLQYHCDVFDPSGKRVNNKDVYAMAKPSKYSDNDTLKSQFQVVALPFPPFESESNYLFQP